MKTRIVAAAIAITAAVAGVRAQQESVVSSGYQANSAPGWTFTPSVAVGETYDDNVSLFDVHLAPGENNDTVTSLSPSGNLTFLGAHTQFNAGYNGSLLAYRTFDTLDRWAQRGEISLKRQESARLLWNAQANAEAMPTTDAVLFGGLPYRRTGVKTLDARSLVEYRFSARDGIAGSAGYQIVSFDRPETVPGFLQGGHAIDASLTWRHELNGRLSVGGDYGIRRAAVVDDTVPVILHTVEGAVNYELTPSWSMSALGGVVFLRANAESDAQTGPAVRIAFTHHRNSLALRTWYQRAFTPSFAFGGTVKSQEAGLGFHSPLFHSRRWYTDQSAYFRDDEPLSNIKEQLPLRSFRTYSTIGWQPQQWVRVEGFYARSQQSSLRVGGLIYRNRIGIQVITSKPVRIQ
jgi:hypothetical protein